MSFCFEIFRITEAESIYACGKIKTESGDFKDSGSFPDNAAKVAIKKIAINKILAHVIKF